MRSRDDLSFPSEATFKNRLGKKREQVEACREFCKAHSGYETVLAWCDKYLAVASLTIESDERTSDEISIGYVYLLKSGRFYKIGKSNAMGRREYEIALQLPEKLKMVHVITTDDPTGIEAYWHKRFEASRKNGEWFDLKPGDVAAFKRRRKFM